MEFEWDEAKRQDTLARRGVDLLYAALIFDGPVLTKVDDRADYGEVRYASLGVVDGVAYTEIHTPRGAKTRLITAWKSGKADHERYKNSLP